MVTQMPLASTVLDLWRLVGEFPVSTVVVFPSMPTTVGDVSHSLLWSVSVFDSLWSGPAWLSGVCVCV